MIRRKYFVVSIAVLTFAAGGAALSQQASPPIARYTIDAGTTSGMAAMSQGGSANVLAMMRGGGGGQAAHELHLHLGSSRDPSGAAEGDHFMPTGAGLGTSVPLTTPVTVSSPKQAPGEMPQGQMPKGRLLLYWGCGEHAGPGQPVVIDFSKLAQGQIPPGLYMQGTDLPEAWSVTRQNSKTFGEWPNTKDSRAIPANSSLLGPHTIKSSYAPDINFTLADDFMPPLNARSSDMASGAINLAWDALPKATGYYAWAIGANMDSSGQSRDMVWWTSATKQQFGGSLADWLSPAAVSRLIAAGTVLDPSRTSCAIPAEVRQAAQMPMIQLYAYGPQADFAYPPRPTDSKLAWKPDWIARVRFRASTTVMHGMPAMGGFSAQEDGSGTDGEGSSSQAPSTPVLPPCPKGLKGMAMRAAKLCY
ncbi:hypothetical protein GRI89_07855 [Altererythrobacter salegens]|uniref:Uncharacterized protein n=1 Tax=Croceibacterium salegens TaxID=1737568 RepID=A0A6I4STV1_9SPHN|nr:hypothetical protein [Croceibacterium salegens]MXO59454.1 hypothetical protein [Croceibacterium salegens]